MMEADAIVLVMYTYCMFTTIAITLMTKHRLASNCAHEAFTQWKKSTVKQDRDTWYGYVVVFCSTIDLS